VKSNGMHRLYDQLEPDERFRLHLLAMARGDEQESERLVRTCPRHTYTMNDRAFTGRWTGAMEITLRVLLPLEQLLCKLQMIDAFRAVIPYAQTLAQNAAFDAYFDGHRSGSYHAWNAAGRTGCPPAWPGEDLEPGEAEDEHDPAMERDMDEIEAKVEKYGELLPELMGRLERELATEAFSLWTGFEGFCAESVGVEAKKVLKVVLSPNPALERVAGLEALAERLQHEVNSEIVGALREGLAENWGVVCERGV
jgi:hypothetical protein